MTQKKTNSNTITANSIFQKLSIQVGLDGLSFCVLNLLSNSIDTFGYSDFNVTYTPENLLSETIAFLEKHNITGQKYKQVLVIHDNNMVSQVPSPLFNKDELATYLKYNIKIFETDTIAWDVVANCDITNVYVPFTNLNNYFFDIFGEFEYKHCSTVLLERLLQERSFQSDTIVYALVAREYFHLVALNNRKLLFSNQFSFKSPEDFLYHTLFVYEQLELDPDKTRLKIIGNMTKDDSYYTLTYKYIRHVDILDTDMKNIKEEYSSKGQFHKFILTNSF